MKAPPKKYTAGDIVAMIRAKYSGRDFAVLEQVPNGTGTYCHSWIDAAVISLWPSKGLYWSAFEVKVDRSDALRELANPKKNEWCRSVFHEFWFAAPKDVIKEAELPEGAGLVVPRGGGLSIVRHAARKNDVTIDGRIVTAFARAMSQQIGRDRSGAVNEFMRTDEFARGKMYRDVVDRHIAKSHDHWYGTSKEQELADALAKCGIEAQAKQDREQVMARLQGFEVAMNKLFNEFLLIAHSSIIERDELGKFIVSKWGGADAETLTDIFNRAKGKVFDTRKAIAHMAAQHAGAKS